MSILTRWYNDQETILYTDYGEIWSWSDIHKHGKNTIAPILSQAKRPIARIADFSCTIWHTSGIFVDNFKQNITRYHDMPVDVTILIVHNEGIRTAMQTLVNQHGAPHRLYAFPLNIDDALTIIHDYRKRTEASIQSS